MLSMVDLRFKTEMESHSLFPCPISQGCSIHRSPMELFHHIPSYCLSKRPLCQARPFAPPGRRSQRISFGRIRRWEFWQRSDSVHACTDGSLKNADSQTHRLTDWNKSRALGFLKRCQLCWAEIFGKSLAGHWLFQSSFPANFCVSWHWVMWHVA